MQEYKTNNKINVIDIIIFLMLLTLSYALKENAIFKYISYLASILVIVFSIILISKKSIKLDKIFLSSIIYIIVNLILLFLNFSQTTLYVIGQQFLLIIFSLSIINLKINKENTKKIYNIFSNTYYILITIIFILHIIGKSNLISLSICKAIFALSFFSFTKTKNKFAFSIISALFFLILGERTSAIIFIFIYMLYKIIGKYNKMSTLNLIFFLTFFSLFLFIVVYIKLPETELGIAINQYSRNIFNENFFSGRHIIWKNVFELTKGKRIFGLIYNNDTSLYYGTNLSTHNLYLWLLLNGGYSLLLTFIMYMYNIWKNYYIHIKLNEVKVMAIYFIGIIILCNFELLLLTNNFSVSIFMWFIISIGINNIKNNLN